MKYEVTNKFISAGATVFILVVLVLFLVFCGFTHKNPPDPPAVVMEVEVQEVELFDDAGGGNMMDGGNYNPKNPKPSPEIPETTASSKQKQSTPATNTATSPTGPKANVPEQPKPNSSAMFGSDKVGTGQTASTAGGTTSGHGGAGGHGDGLGYGNAAGSGGGTGGGTGSGNKGKWVKRPDFNSLSDDKVYDIVLKCTIDDAGNVTEVNVLKNGGASLSLLNKVCEKMKKEAKYSPGHAGTIPVNVQVGRNE
jgi:hypothetical protein